MNASINTSAVNTNAGFAVLDRMLRKRLLEVVGQLRGGRLDIHDPLGQVRLGE